MMFNPIDALEDHIHGDRFVEIADYWWNDREVRFPHATNGQMIVRTADYMPSEMDDRNAILFCRTDNLPSLFNRLKSARGKYVLITHNSDINITNELYATKPDNVIGWFAQNNLVTKLDARIISLPIGLERPNIAESGNVWDFRTNLHKDIKKEKLLYVNFSDNTNAMRAPLKAKLRGMEGVTIQEDRIPFTQYLAEVRQHYFVLSPPGNGWDCHRTWEALYSGSIPIVSGRYSWGLYEPLPIIPIDDNVALYDPEYFLEYISQIDVEKIIERCRLDQLKFDWWAKMIKWYSQNWMVESK